MLTAAATSLKPDSIAVFGDVHETQSKARGFNYTQPVLSIISNQPLITPSACCSLLLHASQHKDPADENETKSRTRFDDGMQRGSFQPPIPRRKLHNNIVKNS